MPAPASAIVFVNDRPVRTDRTGTVLDALAAADADLGTRARAGQVTVTDARGLAVALDEPLHDGMIVRAMASARDRQGG